MLSLFFNILSNVEQFFLRHPVSSHKIFSFTRNFSVKVFLHQQKMLVLQVLQKRQSFSDSSILLIIMIGNIEGFANISMSKDSQEFSRILLSRK